MKNLLEKKYIEFGRLDFPSPPDDDDLDDVYSELIELDGYYAGIANAAISGKKSEYDQGVSIFSLQDSLNSSRVLSNDKTSIFKLRTYVKELCELVRLTNLFYSEKSSKVS